ncbi:MAG: hypothetical protein HY303_12600 [Candidatus Wallbacteria bacterium]|nr:hypothetical protein [Candidatus Wallbacteria bacterium]
MEVVLGGAPLDEQELKEVLSKAAGLLFMRGAWVEVNGPKLSGTLSLWKSVQEQVSGGLPFLDGIRLLAGAGWRRRAAKDIASIGDDWFTDGDEWWAPAEGAWLADAMEALRRPLPAEDLDLRGELLMTLRPYQQSGLAWLLRLHRFGLGGCLADDMGLGKTVQVLVLLLLLKREGAHDAHLLIVPASLIAHWEAEASRLAPSLRLRIIHPSAANADRLLSLGAGALSDCDVLLTSYAYVSKLSWLQGVSWGLLVLDEAQAIKNPNARQSRAVKRLRGRTRLALTGIPWKTAWTIFGRSSTSSTRASWARLWPSAALFAVWKDSSTTTLRRCESSSTRICFDGSSRTRP